MLSQEDILMNKFSYFTSIWTTCCGYNLTYIVLAKIRDVTMKMPVLDGVVKSQLMTGISLYNFTSIQM